MKLKTTLIDLVVLLMQMIAIYTYVYLTVLGIVLLTTHLWVGVAILVCILGATIYYWKTNLKWR